LRQSRIATIAVAAGSLAPMLAFGGWDAPYPKGAGNLDEVANSEQSRIA
jgi:hypothetical protein